MLSINTQDLCHICKQLIIKHNRIFNCPNTNTNSPLSYFNQAEYAVADAMLGEWTVMGNPCSGKDADITFYGQSTHVLPIQGQPDAYMAMFDQWKKTDLIDSRYIVISKL